VDTVLKKQFSAISPAPSARRTGGPSAACRSACQQRSDLAESGWTTRPRRVTVHVVDIVDSFAVNRANWDERAPAHAASPGYRVDRLIADPTYLSEVVRFDVARLGDIAGRRAVHLQCHIGADTLSLARLGARVTGLDFSSASIAEARRIAASAGVAVDFVESNVYEAVDVLGRGAFDLVYTGIGALCWLPDIGRWAATVAGLLRPGGRLFLRDAHPMLYTIDETVTGSLVVRYPYFETAQPLVFDSDLTYVETEGPLTHTTTHEWNHGLGEVLTAVLAAGLQPTMLVEHDSVPWLALPDQMRIGDDGEWRLIDRPERLPLTYTLQAVRPLNEY
jgi:2-polyprenyl-3-methyl-5-hydroxy-6-metoxy-1,4-benzoquinol methylase